MKTLLFLIVCCIYFVNGAVKSRYAHCQFKGNFAMGHICFNESQSSFVADIQLSHLSHEAIVGIHIHENNNCENPGNHFNIDPNNGVDEGDFAITDLTDANGGLHVHSHSINDRFTLEKSVRHSIIGKVIKIHDGIKMSCCRIQTMKERMYKKMTSHRESNHEGRHEQH